MAYPLPQAAQINGGPSPADILYQLEHATEDTSRTAFIANIAMIALATGAVALRFLSRHINGAQLLRDDYTIIIALVFAYGIFVIGIFGIRYGLGRHAVVLGLPKVIKFLEVQFCFELVYGLCNFAIKVSILCLYHRIFVENYRFKKCLYVFGGVATAFMISGIFFTVFQCTPVQLAWDKTITYGKCINTLAVLLSTASINMCMDVILLIMPMPIVWRLRVSLQQRFAVTGIFLLGGLVCFASAIRIYYISQVTFGGDPTWRSYHGAVWSGIEIDLGITCACLPIMRPLFRRLNPSTLINSTVRISKRRIFGLTSSNGNASPGKEKQPSASSSAAASEPSAIDATISWPGRRLEAMLDPNRMSIWESSTPRVPVHLPVNRSQRNTRRPSSDLLPEMPVFPMPPRTLPVKSPERPKGPVTRIRDRIRKSLIHERSFLHLNTLSSHSATSTAAAAAEDVRPPVPPKDNWERVPIATVADLERGIGNGGMF